MGQKKPSELARETLLELASQKLEPTPDNYRKLYVEIGGGDDGTRGASAESTLRDLARKLPRSTPELVLLANNLSDATHACDWVKVQRILFEVADQPRTDTVPAVEWSRLIRNLVRHATDTASAPLSAEKWTAFEVALNAGNDSQKLLKRLESIVTEWETSSTQPGNTRPPAAASRAYGSNEAHTPPSSIELYKLLAQTLETGIAARLIDAPTLATEASDLARHLRESNAVGLENLQSRLKSLWLGIELQGNTQDQLQSALLDLLRLMIDNVGELVANDQWLRGQMNVVLEAITSPLSLDALELAKCNLKEVIFKQSQLKQGLAEVRTTLKQMVASFIDELGKLSSATGDYHDSVENLSQKIRQTDDVHQLNHLLEEVLRETRDVQTCTLRSREEALSARQKVDEAERKVFALETELRQVSEKVQTDYLTGMLNRRGIKEAFDRELAISEREKTPTSVALLDIDNFKDMNDNFGHQVGDEALVHLAMLIRETVRPGDSVARYGGEEFLILLPNADIDQATAVLTRLQRALTKHFFLHDNCKVLITFSTGVTRHLPGESQEAVIARADAALYQAKRAGKNRVVAVQSDDIARQPVMASLTHAAGSWAPA